MVQDERNDAISVRLCLAQEDADPKYITTFYTTAIDQIFKMFLTAKENNVKCYFNEFSTVIPEDLLHLERYVDDVYLNLGNESDTMSIEVVLL